MRDLKKELMSPSKATAVEKQPGIRQYKLTFFVISCVEVVKTDNFSLSFNGTHSVASI